MRPGLKNPKNKQNKQTFFKIRLDYLLLRCSIAFCLHKAVNKCILASIISYFIRQGSLKRPRHPFNISKQTLAVRFYLQPSISTSPRALLAGIPGPYPDFSSPILGRASLLKLPFPIESGHFDYLTFFVYPLSSCLSVWLSPPPPPHVAQVMSTLNSCRCPCLWLPLSLPFIYKKPPPPYLGAIISFPFFLFFFIQSQKKKKIQKTSPKA